MRTRHCELARLSGSIELASYKRLYMWHKMWLEVFLTIVYVVAWSPGEEYHDQKLTYIPHKSR